MANYERNEKRPIMDGFQSLRCLYYGSYLKNSLWSNFPYVSFTDISLYANIVFVLKYWSQLSNKLSYLFLKTSLHLGAPNKKEKICIVDEF